MQGSHGTSATQDANTSGLACHNACLRRKVQVAIDFGFATHDHIKGELCPKRTYHTTCTEIGPYESLLAE